MGLGLKPAAIGVMRNAWCPPTTGASTSQPQLLPAACRFMDGVELFDAAAFRISPSEASVMDPQQRLMLEVHMVTAKFGSAAPACQLQSITA